MSQKLLQRFSTFQLFLRFLPLRAPSPLHILQEITHDAMTRQLVATPRRSELAERFTHVAFQVKQLRIVHPVTMHGNIERTEIIEHHSSTRATITPSTSAFVNVEASLMLFAKSSVCTVISGVALAYHFPTVSRVLKFFCSILKKMLIFS